MKILEIFIIKKLLRDIKLAIYLKWTQIEGTILQMFTHLTIF